MENLRGIGKIKVSDRYIDNFFGRILVQQVERGLRENRFESSLIIS